MAENNENPSASAVIKQDGQLNLNDENPPTSEASKMNQLENDLKKKENEIVILKKRVGQLEEDLTEAQNYKTQQQKHNEEISVLKAATEDTLTRAKSMLFEKTKVIKNQELQIEALNQQVSSMKDVVGITKDLLEIRNLEVKQLESKIKCMEEKYAGEKERYDLMHKKLEHMIRHNGDLKREYETQLCLFSALRERYNERELARDVIDDLRADIAAAGTSNSQVNGEPEAKGTDKDSSEKK